MVLVKQPLGERKMVKNSRFSLSPGSWTQTLDLQMTRQVFYNCATTSLSCYTVLSITDKSNRAKYSIFEPTGINIAFFSTFFLSWGARGCFWSWTLDFGIMRNSINHRSTAWLNYTAKYLKCNLNKLLIVRGDMNQCCLFSSHFFSLFWWQRLFLDLNPWLWDDEALHLTLFYRLTKPYFNCQKCNRLNTECLSHCGLMLPFCSPLFHTLCHQQLLSINLWPQDNEARALQLPHCCLPIIC